MAGIVAVLAGNAGEQVLDVLAGQKIAVAQGRAAKLGQQGVARAVDVDLMPPRHLDRVEHLDCV